jgi:hypothetical protein
LALDHLVLLSHDPDADAARWRDAGFECSERGEHPTLGTCNRLVMFDGAYVEFLGVARPTDANRGYRERLAAGRGCWGLALASPDAVQAAAAWSARGVATGEPYAASRPAKAPDGTPAEARFGILPLAPEATPGGFAFVCTHHTPELVWAAVARHRNGATAVQGITFTGTADEVGTGGDAGTRWAALLGSPLDAAGGAPLGPVRLDFTPGTSQPRLHQLVFARAGRTPLMLTIDATA